MKFDTLEKKLFGKEVFEISKSENSAFLLIFLKFFFSLFHSNRYDKKKCTSRYMVFSPFVKMKKKLNEKGYEILVKTTLYNFFPWRVMIWAIFFFTRAFLLKKTKKKVDIKNIFIIA